MMNGKSRQQINGQWDDEKSMSLGKPYNFMPQELASPNYDPFVVKIVKRNAWGASNKDL